MLNRRKLLTLTAKVIIIATISYDSHLMKRARERVRVCMCLREREKQRQTDRPTGRREGKERKSVAIVNACEDQRTPSPQPPSPPPTHTHKHTSFLSISLCLCLCLSVSLSSPTQSSVKAIANLSMLHIYLHHSSFYCIHI